jgi:hypothetical protein
MDAPKNPKDGEMRFARLLNTGRRSLFMYESLIDRWRLLAGLSAWHSGQLVGFSEVITDPGPAPNKSA